MKNLTFLILLLSIYNMYCQQTSKVDSLRHELIKNPKNFFLQKEILGEFIGNADTKNLQKEINDAKIRFKFNSDFYTYFKINDVFLLLINQEYEKANERLILYDKTLDYNDLNYTRILMNYFKGVIANRMGKHKLAENFFLQSFKVIKENNIEKKHFLNIYNNYASSLLRLGEYEKALSFFFEILKVIPSHDKYEIYTNIGICYYNLKQLENAEKYYKLSVDNSNKLNKANCTANLAILYMEKNDYLKAQEIINKLDFKSFSTLDSAAVFNVLGEVEQNKKNYNKAIANYKIVIGIDGRTKQNAYLANDYLAIGNLYNEINKYELSDFYLNKSLQLLKEFNDKNAEKRVLEGLINLEFCRTNKLKFKQYFDRFLSISDSLNSETVLTNTNRLEAKYRIAEKEAKIKTQQLQLQKEKTNKYIALGGIGLFVLLAAGGFIFYRNKQKQKEKQRELQTKNTLLGLQQNINAMELQNLNQQLNPHEIKNLLGSVSDEIQEKAPESYKKMLKHFNIIKASLNSTDITDTIENQVQQIEDFLSLEKNSLTVPLEYEIVNTIEDTSLKIPRLMLKNLIENAVKHGIKGKETGGNIKVILLEKDNYIYITVDDTGRGRKHSVSLDSGIGTTTYQKLFATLNQLNKYDATFEIIDKELGTRVEIKIPKDYKYS